jgi:hypothetical protein
MNTLAYLAVVGALLAAPTARADNWEKNYQAAPPSRIPLEEEVGEPRIEPPKGNIVSDQLRMWELGYTLIGYSSFSDWMQKTKNAIKLGRKLKANVILLDIHVADTRTSTINLSQPTQTLSTTSGTVKIDGTGGPATGTYSGSTTTYGSETNSFQLSVDIYDKSAVYYRKMRQLGTGLFCRMPTPEERAAAGTNRVLTVVAIRNGSPAYIADILPGDMVVAVNDQPVDPETWASWDKDTIAGNVESAKLTVMRKGERRDIVLMIPPEWRPAPVQR